MTSITAEMLSEAIDRAGVESDRAAWFEVLGGDLSHCVYDGDLNLVRVAEILTKMLGKPSVRQASPRS